MHGPMRNLQCGVVNAESGAKFGARKDPIRHEEKWWQHEENFDPPGSEKVFAMVSLVLLHRRRGQKETMQKRRMKDEAMEEVL